MRRIRSRRGIALILTLMIASLLAMLAGAFVGINHSNIRLVTSQENHRKALEAAQTGVDYARMRMERCTFWGVSSKYSPDMAPAPNIWPAMRVFERLSTGSDARGHTYQVAGVLNGGDSHFQMVFVDPTTANNLTWSNLQPEDGLWTDESIDANPEGGPAAWTQTSVRPLDISINYLNSSLSDPFLRDDPAVPPTYSNSTNRTVPRRSCRVMVLGYCRGIYRKVEVSFGQEELTDAAIASGHDTAVSVNAGGKWIIDSADGNDNQIRANTNFLGPEVTSSNRGVQFRDHTTTNGGTARAGGDVYLSASLNVDYDPALDSFNFSGQGTALDNAQKETAGNLAQGEFSKGSGVNLPPVAASDVENLGKTTFNVTIPTGSYEFIEDNKVRFTPAGGGTPVDYTNQIPNTGPGPSNAVYIKDGKFIVPKDTRVEVNGSVNVSSALPSLKPMVAIGFTTGGNLWPNDSGVLTVKGDLNVNNGTVIGSGSVLATGANSTEPGRITIAGKSDMSADPDLGVTMYSNSTTRLTPPTPGRFRTIDFNAFKSATAGFNSDNWSANKKMNAWGQLNIEEKEALVGSVNASVVNDTVVTAANPTGAGSIRTTNITAEVGALAVSGSAVNTLVNQYPYVRADAAAMANLTALLDAYTTGTGDVNGLSVAADPGMTTGRYLRVREWLRANDNHLQEGGAAAAGTLAPSSNYWVDLTNPNSNQNIGHMAINQLDYYERQRGNVGSGSLQSMLGHTSNPISGGTADATFKGLIFSKKHIACDVGGGTFSVDGAMIANGTVGIGDAKNVLTRYNPVYVDALVKQLYGRKGTKLAVTFWATH